ncbi:hypothetical protein ERO13_D13G216400v2 [Gossypium hirsutum]|uniref:Transcription factor bHLH146 n=4 Tax=Gossypium TaxID=3633 RepID=A0ABM3BEL2_GOSHI|nr:transcription factor bHLH146-like [Gossypium hirsutum]KAB1996670.1 hypothetical protein ES319_D13G247500v1 [Gossypium barbadense]TYH36427.1 hypothetical protein ES332_D13G264200v1 [Gossypium tomentosum]TYI48510.1 hypothetical protein E1A91_D13G253800v1 [Gossypium mustelinum]KAG4113325.1 hypothetical protein ERO13_D13G216400v2 [Gossypium hirsutum]PPD88562.1 hypothetical protein GOBAR_DD14489 [Gossypium barbadense]
MLKLYILVFCKQVGMKSYERKRTYPMKSSKVIHSTTFTTKYASYLVPALTNIGRSRASCDVDEETKKMVRYEVDMALALSAKGFAWSRALKHKLRLNYKDDDRVGDGHGEPVTKKPKTEHEEEERMMCLRKLIPGGKEMMADDEMLLSELGSYVSCLELQVNILRSMLQNN